MKCPRTKTYRIIRSLELIINLFLFFFLTEMQPQEATSFFFFFCRGREVKPCLHNYFFKIKTSNKRESVVVISCYIYTVCIYANLLQKGCSFMCGLQITEFLEKNTHTHTIKQITVDLGTSQIANLAPSFCRGFNIEQWS